MHPMLNVATKAARRAATVINRAAGDLESVRVEIKNPRDFVTEIDRNAESAIVEVLQNAFPAHQFLGEESGLIKAANPATEGDDYLWIIDPIDGTTNFIHGFPQYAISIALQKNGVLDQGLIFDPVANELFTASKGGGAFLNDRRLRVSRRFKMQEALISTGFPFRETDDLESYINTFREISKQSAGIRRPGAASLDLAWLAAGRVDGFWELGLSIWDIAAGSLMVTEAGGLITDLSGESNHLQTGNVVAGNPKIFAQILPIVQKHKPTGVLA